VRIARAATGRRILIKFKDHYDGWYDPIHVGVPGRPGSGPGTGGQDPEAARSTLVCPWNDIEALRGLLDSDVAAVIMEPINVNGGCILPAPGYLEQAKDLIHKAGAVLIFDEVITGYRAALGGAQEYLGVTPDLTVLGKALGAGVPISAVAGSADVMSVVGPEVAHVGTFNLNPLAAAAALAAVRYLQAGHRDIYPRLDAVGSALASVFREASKEGGLPLEVNQVGAIAHAYAPPPPGDRETYLDLAAGLLGAGVQVIPRGTLYVSTEHTDDDVALTRDAVRIATQAARRGPGAGRP
jgi:glutamate-1-semialdehyde 2,1-aminomutase